MARGLAVMSGPFRFWRVGAGVAKSEIFTKNLDLQ